MGHYLSVHDLCTQSKSAREEWKVKAAAESKYTAHEKAPKLRTYITALIWIELKRQDLWQGAKLNSSGNFKRVDMNVLYCFQNKSHLLYRDAASWLHPLLDLIYKVAIMTPFHRAQASQWCCFNVRRTRDKLNPQDNPVSADLLTWYIWLCYIRSSLLQNNIRQTAAWPQAEPSPLTWSCTAFLLHGMEAVSEKKKSTFERVWMAFIDVLVKSKCKDNNNNDILE